MPSVIDAPESMEYVDTYDLTIETMEPRERGCTRPGLWRTLVQSMVTFLTPARRERSAPSCRVSHPCEPSMDRFAREYPSLALYALAMI